jgi:hypothetical protein
MTGEDDNDQNDIVADGEAVSVGFFSRDSGGWSAAITVDDRLRDMDTGALVTLDSARVAAIRVEASRAGLPVASYLRDRLRYAIERP